MFTKQNMHKAFLLISAAVITAGAILIMNLGDYFDAQGFLSFTVQSNLLTAIAFVLMVILYNRECKLRSYIAFSVMVSITITGLVYNLVLVPAVEEILPITSDFPNFSTHFLSMVLALGNYFVFEKKGTFTFSHIIAGVIFPIIYWIVFISIGEIINYFPYFFMEPQVIGWPMAFVWFGIIFIAVSVLSLALVFFDRWRGKKQSGQLMN
ncbi:MAG: Pr6Pr family membrane protein [Defluviitaleaceae bacterium]|nr:Pr6Pr family membrane protein [Defluviitaleaceae bacterium]MCL2239615.1 Pr6Pr family membrane protein [Defluviitaleaceae bacterium]